MRPLSRSTTRARQCRSRLSAIVRVYGTDESRSQSAGRFMYARMPDLFGLLELEYVCAPRVRACVKLVNDSARVCMLCARLEYNG